MATVFVGGSALLLAGAMAALAFGFANGEEALVWIALLASGAAAVFLVIAYGLSRRELGRTSSSSAPEAEAPSEPDGDPEGPADDRDDADDPSPGSAATAPGFETAPPEGPEEGGSLPVAAGSPTAAKPSTVKKGSAPGTVVAAKPSSPSDTVVGIASKKKFHRPECRYAKSESAEEMTRAAARRRGFAPCGICKA